MNWYEKLRDSYDHYRRQMRFNPVYAAYRAVRYEIVGVDKWTWGDEPMKDAPKDMDQFIAMIEACLGNPLSVDERLQAEELYRMTIGDE